MIDLILCFHWDALIELLLLLFWKITLNLMFNAHSSPFKNGFHHSFVTELIVHTYTLKSSGSKETAYVDKGP